jgi:RND family efflux transporter MFP subunit
LSDIDISKLHIDRGVTAAGAPRKRRRVWPWLIAIAALATTGYFAFGRNAAISVETITVTQAYPSQAHTQLNATGYVVAQRKAAVASKATGRLEWLGVREGSVVKEGEVLARLENKDVIAAQQQAQANVGVARANLEQSMAEFRDAERALARSRDLLDKNFVSAAAHDAVIARHEKAKAAISGFKAAIGAAEASVRSAQVAVEQTLIRAPFDGVVLTKNANVGDVITPFSSALGSQAAVVTMADMTTLEVEADVSESNLSKVKPQQPCEIQLDALPEARFRGTVLRLVPTVDRSKATVLAKIQFVDKDARILPEMSAKVAFLGQEMPESERTPRVVLQPFAVVERNGGRVVYVVKEGKAVETSVVTGSKIGELVEVKSGVKTGERIVARPSEKLRDGTAVTVQTK